MPFHINPESGKPSTCRAQEGNCPFGPDTDHYESKAQARDAYEISQGSPFPGSREAVLARMDARFAKPAVAVKAKQDDILALSHEDWTTIATELEGPKNKRLAEYRAANQAFINQAVRNVYPLGHPANKVKQLEKISDDARETLNKVLRTYNLAVAAAAITAPREVDGLPIPPGHDVVPAVYDLDGNFLAAARDTRVSHQSITLADGSKLKYRRSTAQDEAKAVATEAKKGYYTGTAVVPVELEYTRDGFTPKAIRGLSTGNSSVRPLDFQAKIED